MRAEQRVLYIQRIYLLNLEIFTAPAHYVGPSSGCFNQNRYPSNTNSDYTENGSYIVTISLNGTQFANRISIIDPDAIKSTQEIAS